MKHARLSLADVHDLERPLTSISLYRIDNVRYSVNSVSLHDRQTMAIDRDSEVRDTGDRHNPEAVTQCAIDIHHGKGDRRTANIATNAIDQSQVGRSIVE